MGKFTCKWFNRYTKIVEYMGETIWIARHNGDIYYREYDISKAWLFSNCTNFDEAIEWAKKRLIERTGVPEDQEEPIPFQYNDGGRSKYYKAQGVGDCVTRAVAIASQKDYKEIYDLIAKVTKKTPRNGVMTRTESFKRMMRELGFRWVSCMEIGSGCRVHLKAEELPKGRIVCRVTRHYTAIIDGVMNDTYDCSRDGNRCVYGYWVFEG